MSRWGEGATHLLSDGSEVVHNRPNEEVEGHEVANDEPRDEEEAAEGPIGLYGREVGAGSVHALRGVGQGGVW